MRHFSRRSTPRPVGTLHVEDHAPPDPTVPAIVLVHGLLTAGWVWGEVVTRVGGGRRVLVPDLRGHGRSDPSPDDVSLADLVDDLVAILDASRVGPVVLVGLSLGALVCLHAAVRLAGRVSALVLVAMPLAPETADTRRRRLGTLEAMSRLGSRAVLRGMAAWLFGRTTRRDTPERIEHWLDQSAGLDPVAVVRTAHAALSRPDAWDLLGRVRVPTLVVVGDEDDVLGRSEARATAAGIAGATLRELRGAGHLVPLERGAELAQVINTWLARGGHHATGTS